MNRAGKHPSPCDEQVLVAWVSNPPPPRQAGGSQQIQYGNGALLDQLSPGARLLVTTQDREFLLEMKHGGRLEILGDTLPWPQPAMVRLYPSDASGAIHRGMWMEFQKPGGSMEQSSVIRHVWVLEDGA